MTTTPTQPDALPSAVTTQPAVWLRDNCPCAACRDPRNGQKLFTITDLPPDLAVVDVDGTTITFSDGHVSRFDPAFLSAEPAPDDRTEDAKRPWATTEPPEHDWSRFLSEPEHRADCLDAVLTTGFTLLRGVPVTEGTVLEVAANFGFVRETNYGKLFDVRVEATPTNLAFTGLAITPHTDNPYRDPVPTVQLLHCLANAVDGGESGLVDGFHAAALLRTEDPDAFGVLTRTPVTFRYADAGAELVATRPMIGVDPTGRIREVRFNNRSMQALRLPAEETAAFYTAYRRFAEILGRPELMVTFRLGPGDCVVFDNTRLLHARTGFADTGDRHLQGCYADLDAISSQHRVLRGRLASAHLRELFDGPGTADYLGEEVTQAQHMLQAAALAEGDGAPAELVVATLLHDVGHFTGPLTGTDLMGGTDNRHSHVAADWLSRWFGPAVTEPVRLHVAAKRYLCAVDPAYLQVLSPASAYTLEVQGGPMEAAEVAVFEAEPYARDAVRLRRWDDAAKDPTLTVPGFDHYQDRIALLARGGASSPRSRRDHGRSH
jgi:gamma-butyrobetaine dioxygenase